MPKAVIAVMKKGYAGSGLSEKEINHRVYGALNNMGAMHGSQETAKGVAFESRYQADHSVIRKAKAAVRAKKYLAGSR